MPPGDGDFSDGEIWQVEDGFGHTATVYGDDEEGAANARLIAAAPDLLAALRLFVNEGPSRARQCNCDDYEPGIQCDQCIAWAAIDKAEGRTDGHEAAD
jgi:hypothetical protein